MSQKYICDRCNKIIEKNYHAADVSIREYLTLRKREDKYDLCPKCLDEFETEFLKNVKFKDEE